MAAPDAHTQVIRRYCSGCHNDRMKTGGLTLAAFDAARPEESPEVAEKIIRKLRAGMMPPAGVLRRPDEAARLALVGALETRLDELAARRPDPGWRPFQRLNRAEYARAIRELFDLDVDVDAFLPPDTVSRGFDNIADVQAFSPTLMEGYLRAASRISSLAVGDRTAAPGSTTYKVPRTASQMRHIEGTPIGTRGGLSVVHVFPADGEYTFKLLLHGGPTGELFGDGTIGIRGLEEQIEVSINGARAALLDVDREMNEATPAGLTLETPRIHVPAGPQRLAAAFIQRFEGPVDDLVAPIDYTLAETTIGNAAGGVTALPHLRDLMILGPYHVTGVSETPSRRRIFTCRPTSAAEEAACAASIVERLATQAYRRPVRPDELDNLMARFYDAGRQEGGFEAGIRLALQAILASPQFLFRFEEAPPARRAGEPYRLDDLALASRLSFFLWGTVPDEALLAAARDEALRKPAGLERHVRRMLADPRSEALATRFAAQWLRLQDVDKVRPDPLLFPYWDQSLSDSFRRETELVFDSLLRDDRSVLELLTADHTFVNERLARHYGVPNIVGHEFRRVPVPDERRGMLGHGSILLLTSVADRTSPVQRGKWVMEVLLGTPPPPPPPNVPELEETKAAAAGRVLSVRERMEEHRSNPACTSCHRVIDPLGLALENFDVTGRWRVKDNGVPVDATGELYDGTIMDGPAGLREALLKHSDLVILSFTESLLTYAIGRRVEYFDMPAVRAIVREASRDGYRMSALILGVVRSAAFQMSRHMDAPTTDAEVGGRP